MADTEGEISNGAILLESTSHIPIAQLTPFLEAPSARSVKAIVTLTWPYSSATGSVAFLLAEPDFRLRRTRGQVRAQFSGSSAKAVAKSGIASGDEVTLSLDGAEWIQDEAPFATPGRGIEYDLRFTERLLLQFRQEESSDVVLIDIDHSTPYETTAQERIPSPEVTSSPFTTANSTLLSTRASPLINNGEEWPSPAFIKRARDSYGSLFDKEYDPFAEEDGTILGKGRKKPRQEPRLSRTWRYESRSQSPEVGREHQLDTSPELDVQQKPLMADEGSQTVGLDDGGAAEVLAEFHKQGTNVGSSSYLATNGGRLEPQGQVIVAAHDETQSTELPSIQTQLSPENATIPQQDNQYAVPAPHFPSSPRLQPIPSDGLPLVSPLITNKFGAFLGMGPPERISDQAAKPDHKTSASVKESMRTDDLHEDMHGASLAAVHGQFLLNNFRDFHDPSVSMHILEEAANMHNRPLLEDQYGNWQSVNTQKRHTTSSSTVDEQAMDRQRQDGILVDSDQEGFEPLSVGFLVPETSQQQQYPAPDEDNFGAQTPPLWEPETQRPPYRDLPDNEPESNNVRFNQEESHSRAAAISDSENSRFVPTELAENGAEGEVDRDFKGDDPINDLGNEEHSEDSIIEEDGVKSDYETDNPSKDYRDFRGASSEDEEEGSMDVEHVPRWRAGLKSNDEDALQYMSGEDELSHEVYEEDSVENDGHYQRRREYFDQEQDEESNEDEEGSYDEEMEDDEERVPRDPVIIDLLSSDDEDREPDAPNVKPVTSFRLSGVESFERGSDFDQDMELIEETRQSPAPKSRHEVHPTNLQEDSEKLDPSNIGENDESVTEARDDHLPHTETANYDGNNKLDAAAGDDSDDDGNKASVTIEKRNEMIMVDRNLEDDEGGEAIEDEVLDNVTKYDIEEVHLQKPQEKQPHEKRTLQEVAEHRDVQSPEESEPGPLKIGQFLTHLSGYPLLQSPPYSMDGGNDESPALYLSLPKGGTFKSALSDVSSQKALERSAQPTGQLPTPADTQRSLVSESSDISTPPVIVQPHLSHKTLDQLLIDPELEPTVQLPNVDKVIVDNAATRVEVEVSATAEIGKETAGISLEEDSIKRADSERGAPGLIEVHNTRSRTRRQNSPTPIIDDEVGSVESTNFVSPRRSHRQGKSISSTTEAPQAKLPTTPSQSASKVRRNEPDSARTQRSSSMILDEETTPKGQDASIQLAMAALDSPTKQPHDLRSNEPGVGMKLKLTRALRTELSEFTSLKMLKFKNTQKLDILGVVTMIPPEPQRAKAGPRHYQITFNITDHSIAPGGPYVIEVQVFRPYKDALPLVKVGDGILLRDFQVVSLKRSGFGLRSVETSSWAVFRDDGEEAVEVRGPPVEYGPDEQKQLALLRNWYRDLDSVVTEKIKRANGEKGTISAGKDTGKAI